MQKEHTTEEINSVIKELDPERRRSRLAEERKVDRAQVRHMTDHRPHLRLMAVTGWHVTELARFAESGRIYDPTPMQAQDGAAAILETVHKSGEVFRMRVGDVGAEAARRVHVASGFSIERYAKAVKEAVEAAGVKGFRGAVRHSALTWASKLEGEEAAQKVARHKSARTSKKFYAERAAPPNPLTRLQLVK